MAMCCVFSHILLHVMLIAAVAPAPSSDPNYWVQLQMIAPSVGQLFSAESEQSGFQPQLSKFVVEVAQPKVTALTLALDINTSAYLARDNPKVYVDGHRRDSGRQYITLGRIVEHVPLNESWQAFDMIIKIKLQDPYELSWRHDFFHKLLPFTYHTPQHEYEVRITQPPDLGTEPMLKGLIMKDSTGNAVASNPSFSSDAKDCDYDFTLPAGTSKFTLEAVCSEKANHLEYQYKPAEVGRAYQGDVGSKASESLVFKCSHTDARWPEFGRGRMCFATVQQTLTLDGATIVLVPADGDSLCKAEESKKDSFVCRVTADRMKFFIHTSDFRAKAQLINKAGGPPIQLPTAHVRELVVGTGRQEHTLMLTMGSAVRNYSVTVLRPAWCAALSCSAGLVLNLESGDNAARATCALETCSTKDEETCCERRDTCNLFTWPCPSGSVLRQDANRTLCKGARCVAKDASTCCGTKAVCTTLQCPTGSMLRKDAQNVRCERDLCAESDSGKCCMGWLSHYVFGYVKARQPKTVTSHAAYLIQFDFGLVETVPEWAIVKFDSIAGQLETGQLHVGDRVEARVNKTTALRLIRSDVTVLGIGVREKLHHYMTIGCSPMPQICMGIIEPGVYAVPQQVGLLPISNAVGIPPYDATKNKEKKQLCYYDPSCNTNASQPGCHYWSHVTHPQPYPVGHGPTRKGWHDFCRACGWGDYPPCPSVPDCSDEDPVVWPEKKRKFCCKKYRIACPFNCRFGDDTVHKKRNVSTVDEVVRNEHFRYWSTEQKVWCCENENEGCREAKGTSTAVIGEAEGGFHRGGVFGSAVVSHGPTTVVMGMGITFTMTLMGWFLTKRLVRPSLTHHRWAYPWAENIGNFSLVRNEFH